MILNTLKQNKPVAELESVGKLAMDTLRMHRDDLVIGGIVVKRGTPVFSPKVGWYHDALIYEANKLNLAKGERYESVDLIDVAFRMIDLKKQDKNPIALISVKSDLWFLPPEVGDKNTNHLVIVSGFEFSNNSLLKVKVTDPRIRANGTTLVNEWISVDKSKLLALNSRAMIFFN